MRAKKGKANWEISDGTVDEKINTEHLATFLYLLMRDELPTGKVARIIQEVEKNKSHFDVEFSNRNLSGMAREYAERILKADAPTPEVDNG